MGRREHGNVIGNPCRDENQSHFQHYWRMIILNPATFNFYVPERIGIIGAPVSVLFIAIINRYLRNSISNLELSLITIICILLIIWLYKLSRKQFSIQIEENRFVTRKNVYYSSDISELRIIKKQRRMMIKINSLWGWRNLTFPPNQAQTALEKIEEWAISNKVSLEKK